MEQLKTFCISLKNNIISENLSKECLESGKKFKWKIIQFEATSIEDVNNEIWKKFNVIPSKDNKFQKRIGAQGCYLSHFRLWNICIDLNEPIIILEHDAIVSNIFPNIETDLDLIKLHLPIKKMKYNEHTGNWSIGSHAYYLKPLGAKKLIKWSKVFFGYHVDMMLGSNVLNYTHLDYDLIKLNKNNISTINIKKK